METEYEFKVVNVGKKNKEFYGFWTQRFTTRARKVFEKLTKEGWEPTDTTHDFMGHPKVLTFRRKK